MEKKFFLLMLSPLPFALILLCAMLSALCLPAEAQQPKKIARIGYLSPSDPATDSIRSGPFRAALRELGYVEGQNIAIEYRYAEGKVDRFAELAAEPVRLNCDVIVTNGNGAAQQPRKVARIRYLGAADASNSLSFTKPFRERLREIGYIDGQNLTIEFRESEGKVERLPGLAAELVRLNCDVIVTNGNGAAQAAKNATKTIPIVMGWGPDAVRRGIVSDLARPAGNITGLTDYGRRAVWETARTAQGSSSQTRTRRFSLDSEFDFGGER